MAPVLLALVGVVLALAACSSGPERQWYKAGGYTVAEFERDRVACTKDGVVDEQCLRSRGWIPLSADTKPAEKPPEPVRGTY